ncbi:MULTISPECIES: hypothetical protein [Brucella]|uniref:hypothetical protein n=1 Tax=Brucella TaxID=234 RepID=UPI0003451A75|nr:MULTISPECIES: hypothetical protein [Brucella]MCH6205467.1 hypothetical protein [Brucella ciceri]
MTLSKEEVFSDEQIFLVHCAGRIAWRLRIVELSLAEVRWPDPPSAQSRYVGMG